MRRMQRSLLTWLDYIGICIIIIAIFTVPTSWQFKSMVLFCSVVHAFTFNRLLVLLTPPPLLPECKMRIKNTHPPEPPKKPTTELYKLLSTQLSFRIKRGSDVMKAHSLVIFTIKSSHPKIKLELRIKLFRFWLFHFQLPVWMQPLL